MKQSIAWHKDVLRNRKRSLEERGKRLKQLQHEYAVSLANFLFYEHQVTEAKKFGKDGFDRERFCKHHKSKKP